MTPSSSRCMRNSVATRIGSPKALSIIALVAGLQLDPRFKSDAERVSQFAVETGMSRKTYYRLKKRMPQPISPPGIVLRHASTLRLVHDAS